MNIDTVKLSLPFRWVKYLIKTMNINTVKLSLPFRWVKYLIKTMNIDTVKLSLPFRVQYLIQDYDFQGSVSYPRL